MGPAQDSDPFPALNWISGTSIDPVPMVGRSVAKARLWIEECLNHHESCQGYGESCPILPTYILNVGTDASDPLVRLIETHSTMTGHYAYLFARWTKSVDGSMTTQANLNELTKSVPLRDLPPGCSDAVTTIRRLGLRYLWTDRFCIVQDSPGSKDTEFRQAPRYIQSAFLLLVVASGDHLPSFLRPRNPPLLHMDVIQSAPTGYSQGQDAITESLKPRLPSKAPNFTPMSEKIRLYIRHPLETAYHALREGSDESVNDVGDSSSKRNAHFGQKSALLALPHRAPLRR